MNLDDELKDIIRRLPDKAPEQMYGTTGWGGTRRHNDGYQHQ